MAKPSRETPIYTVWRPDIEPEDEGKPYDAIDVPCAANLYATYCHRHRDGWEWSWPVTFRVRDPDGAIWVVEVELEMVPEFLPGKPLPMDMPTMVHVLYGGALCGDPRLRDHWPDNQKFFKVDEIRRGDANVSKVSCDRCKRMASQIIMAMDQIGVGRG